jgi:hypothetical protein
MSITINNTKPVNGSDSNQWIEITVNADGDDCKLTHTAPKDLSGDDLQAYVDGREDFYKTEILRNMYKGADAYDKSLEDFESWISDGCKNAEVSETRVTVNAVTAKDAVMGERQKTTTKEVEVSTTDIVKEGGKYVEKTTTVTKQVAEDVTEEVDLYNESGENIGKHTVPVMESYEVSPAVEAVDEVTEKVVIKAAETISKKAWVDSH